MAELGAISLWIALALAAYSTTGSVIGKLRLAPALVESAKTAMYVAALALLVSTLSLVIAFISRDFEIAYVAAHSDLAMENKFTWVAFYAGNEGSLLYIGTILAIMSSVAVWRSPEKFRDALPYTTAVLMLTLSFFLSVTAIMANPFEKLPFVPIDGEGINPLLTHFGMFFHPPALMAGLIGITIPFAFATGALLAGKTADEWVDPGRVWGIISWALLASGLLLGSWWAYTILGWGGFWFWDPVENAAFMPWLGITAFIHSIMVQKRRGMFRMWNIVLVNVSFGLALYGMFMNRGGSVPSVHSFGESSLGWIFLMFLAIGVIIPFAIFIWRYPLLKSARNLDSMLSREAAFLINNMLLLAIAFVTLWDTVYPLLSRFTNDEEITVARPFYDQVNGPLMLALVFLMGIGPLIPWRKATLTSVRRSLLPPIIGGLATVAILVILGLHKEYALVGFGLSSFVTTGILMEWYRGTRSRRRSSGENYAASFIHLIMANRPRYGGYIVHLSVVMVTLGIVGTSFFSTQKDVVMNPGDRVSIEDYELAYLGSIETPKGNRTEYISTVQIFKDGELMDTTRPQRDFYPSFNMASTSAAIRSTPVEDLYIVPSENLPDGSVGFRILVNPLIWWMWVGGPVMVIGTIIALWPQKVSTSVPVPSYGRFTPGTRPTAA